jgi:hypothetical protein
MFFDSNQAHIRLAVGSRVTVDHDKVSSDYVVARVATFRPTFQGDRYPAGLPRPKNGRVATLNGFPRSGRLFTFDLLLKNSSFTLSHS